MGIWSLVRSLRPHSSAAGNPPEARLASGPGIYKALIYELDIARLPLAFKPGLQRTVKPKNSEPALIGDGLNPIRLMSLRCLWAKPQRNRSISIDHHITIALIVFRRIRLAGLQHRTSLGVIDHDGPEVLGRNVGRDIDLIGLRPVEISTLGIRCGKRVLRSNARQFQDHRGRIHRRDVIEHGSRIFIATARSIAP